MSINVQGKTLIKYHLYWYVLQQSTAREGVFFFFSFFLISHQAFMSLNGMFIESRPVSLVLPESPHVVVCFSLLIDGEGGLVSNRKTGNIGARFPNLSEQLRLEDQFDTR